MPMKKLAWIVFYLISVGISAELAARLALKNQLAGFRVGLAETQAMLSFNYLRRYGEIENDLARGCIIEALAKVKISKAQETSLLASFLKEHPDTSLNKYVDDRDPGLVERLVNYKSPYGNTWSEPECKK
jgi:hypothetical protein